MTRLHTISVSLMDPLEVEDEPNQRQQHSPPLNSSPQKQQNSYSAIHSSQNHYNTRQSNGNASHTDTAHTASNSYRTQSNRRAHASQLNQKTPIRARRQRVPTTNTHQNIANNHLHRTQAPPVNCSTDSLSSLSSSTSGTTYLPREEYPVPQKYTAPAASKSRVAQNSSRRQGTPSSSNTTSSRYNTRTNKRAHPNPATQKLKSKRPSSAPLKKRPLTGPRSGSSTPLWRTSSNRRRPQSSKSTRSKRSSGSSDGKLSSSMSATRNSVQAFNGEISVMTRFRPLLFPEVDPHPTEVDISYTKSDDGTTVSLNERKIHLHKDMICLQPDTTQEELYMQHVKRQVQNFAQSGTTGCVLLYGKTGSGKTHTAGVGESQICSKKRAKSKKNSTKTSREAERKKNRGIITRSLRDVFDQLEQEHGPQDSDQNLSSSTSNTSPTTTGTEDFRIAQDSDYMVHLCMIEVYGKEIFDMLAPQRERKKRKLECQAYGSLFYACYSDEKQDPINSRVRYQVKSYKDAMKLIRRGIKRREVGEHKENKHSSRSHCLIFIHVTKNSKVMTPHSTSTFVVADLCGAELVKKTSSDARLTSGINSSLSFLKDILVIMSKKSTSISFEIKFRYHPLCKLLKCCMVSSFHPTVISLIVCCTLAQRDLNETVSSLKFANMASQIRISSIQAKTTAKQALYDKKALEAELASLRYQLNAKVEKIRRLQDELSRAKLSSSSSPSKGVDHSSAMPQQQEGSQQSSDRSQRMTQHELEIGIAEEHELRKELKKLTDLKEQINDLQNVKQQLDFEIEEYKKLQAENEKMQEERRQLIEKQKLSDQHSQNLKQVIEAFCDSMQEIMTLTKSDATHADGLVDQLLEDLHSCLQPAVPIKDDKSGEADEQSNTDIAELDRVLSSIRQLPDNLRLFKSKYQKILKTSLTSTLQKQKDKFKDILKQVQTKHEEIVQRVHAKLEAERVERKTREQQLLDRIAAMEKQIQEQQQHQEQLERQLTEKDELLNQLAGVTDQSVVEASFSLEEEEDDDE